jgi:CheY-like chemotaxis protein
VSVSAANGVRASVILVVEDQFLVRDDVATRLRDAGFVVVEAQSGEAAIELCHSEAPIDVVFTDINLGGSVSGWDVARSFRTRRPDISVLYTSGDVIDRSRCVRGSAFIAKPYRNIDVMDACQRLSTK